MMEMAMLMARYWRRMTTSRRAIFRLFVIAALQLVAEIIGRLEEYPLHCYADIFQSVKKLKNCKTALAAMEVGQEQKEEKSDKASDEEAAKAEEVPVHFFKSPALEFSVLAECGTCDARRSRMLLPHGRVDCPVFMPVGTQGTLKGLLASEIRDDIGCQIMLANTYHLSLRPGTPVIDAMGGIHAFMSQSSDSSSSKHCNILTDSGGFQMVSLLELAEFGEEGVTFQSPMDGTQMLLTPEKCMQAQNEIGSDIMMALDDVVPATCASQARFVEATHRSIRWLGRCIAAHAKPEAQNLFGIVQGGLDEKLRRVCLEAMLTQYDADLPGYAIGGLSGGESKDDFWRIIHFCASRLPKKKPRYAMGVGYALDLVVCVALGVDMFDCVYPCRTARFGTALCTDGRELQLKKKRFEADFAPIDAECDCSTCALYSRAYLHQVVGKKESNAAQLLTTHNIRYLANLMRKMREAIAADSFPQFVRAFMAKMFASAGGADAYPKWAVDAFECVGIKLRK